MYKSALIGFAKQTFVLAAVELLQYVVSTASSGHVVDTVPERRYRKHDEMPCC